MYWVDLLFNCLLIDVVLRIISNLRQFSVPLRLSIYFSFFIQAYTRISEYKMLYNSKSDMVTAHPQFDCVVLYCIVSYDLQCRMLLADIFKMLIT